MKKTVSIILALLMLCSTGMGLFSASAATTVASGRDGYINWTLDSNGLLTLTGSGSMKNFTESERPSFERYKNQIKSLSIGSGITTVGHYAFYKYTALTGDLSLPKTIKSVGGSAFDGCTGLNGRLRLNEGLQSIDVGSFRDCNFVGDLTLPNSLITIDSCAFQRCASFNGKLTFGNSLTKIGYAAFSNCSGLTGSIVIPDSVTEIGSYAFYFCTGLDGTIKIGENVALIGNIAFYQCYNLTGVLELPESVRTVGTCAFHGCAYNTDLLKFFSSCPQLITRSETVRKYATCTTDGEKEIVVKCASCNMAVKTFLETTPAEHTLSPVPFIAPSEDADGNIAYYACTRCNKLFEDQDGVTELQQQDVVLHYAADPVRENSKKESETTPASYDLVTYCKHDGTELSRETVTLTVHEAKEATAEEAGNVKYYTDEDGNKYVFDEETNSFVETEDVAVEFTGIPVESLKTIDGLTIHTTSTYQIEVQVLPGDATDKTVVFTVDDPTIVSVDENGFLTPLAIGETTVTCTASNGVSASIDVKVIHGHSELERVYINVEIEPTCVTAGYGELVDRCVECGEIVTHHGKHSIPATSIHETEFVPEREPTEEADGYIDHYVCSSCGTLFQDREAKQPTTQEAVTLHYADEPKMENSRPESGDQPAAFDLVTYCKHDGTELSRETVTLTMHEAKEATAEEAGNVKYYTDDDDNKYVFDEETNTFVETEDVVVEFTGIPVEEIGKIDDLTITSKDTYQIEVTILPENATDKSVTFSVVDPTIVSVDENGLLTPLALGTTTVTCTASNGVSTSFEVEIIHGHGEVRQEYINIETQPTCVEDGYGELVDVCVECGEVVTSYGKQSIPATGIHDIEPVPEREATEEADGCTQHYICVSCGALFTDEAAENSTTAVEVAIHFPDTPVQENVKTESENDPASFELVTYCKHDDTELNRETVTLEVHPATEASLLGDGNVKYYTDEDGNKYVFDEETNTFVETEDVLVPFVPIPVEKLNANVSELNLFIGESFQIETTTEPEDATFPQVIFSSSDPSVVEVNPLGLVTAKGEGTATIEARTGDGATVTVTVTIRHTHIASEETQKIVIKEATCTETGLCEVTTVCAVCGAELERAEQVIEKKDHVAASAVKQDEVAATCETEGSYTSVICCKDCGLVLSSEIVATPKADHNWNDGEVQSGQYDKYTVTDYTCKDCGTHKTEKTRNPNYQFRCKRCDWYDARKDTKGVLGLIYSMIHSITHMVQRINFMT